MRIINYSRRFLKLGGEFFIICVGSLARENEVYIICVGPYAWDARVIRYLLGVLSFRNDLYVIS